MARISSSILLWDIKELGSRHPRNGSSTARGPSYPPPSHQHTSMPVYQYASLGLWALPQPVELVVDVGQLAVDIRELTEPRFVDLDLGLEHP